MAAVRSASARVSGEYFICTSAAHQVCARVQWKGEDIKTAGDATIKAIGDIGGDGGLIAMDGKGRPAFPMNSSGMYRGWASSTASAATAIYADEAGPH
ncbi:MAG: isoaspartyl peptidase/L-asparaginase [Alphaproteobacteria bacterium]|nr:isoaspartyl peptidase/L-asparaginase [Alphaproteobacteria bacterium]